MFLSGNDHIDEEIISALVNTDPNNELFTSSNKKMIIDILGIIVNHVVTIVGTSSYTSGAQLCKGAAATLNKNPNTINNKPKTGIIELEVLFILNTKLNIDSKLVRPV
jgi:hypothetical protein